MNNAVRGAQFSPLSALNQMTNRFRPAIAAATACFSLLVGFQPNISAAAQGDSSQHGDGSPEQRQLDMQTRALQEILAAADRICVTPPIEERDQRVELTGEAKAKLAGIIAKVADLGIGGAAKYQSGDSKGVLQEKLADALKNGNDCKLTVLSTLKAMIPGLVSPSSDAKPAPPERRQSTPPTSGAPMVIINAPIMSQNQPIPGPPGMGLVPGMILMSSGSIQNGIGHKLQLIFRFTFPNGQPLMANPQEAVFRDPLGGVITYTLVGMVEHDPGDLAKLTASIPYFALNFAPSQPPMEYPLAVVAIAMLDGIAVAQSPPAAFVLGF